MKKSTLLILSGFLAFFVSCDNSDGGGDSAFYKITNNGQAGVSSVTDTQDISGLGIAQAIPSVSNEIYPANVPILFFFDDKILLSSITEETFIVTENGEKVGGTISINEAANGFAILSFIPKKQFAGNAAIQIIITTDLKDDAGLGSSVEKVIDYTTASVQDGSFDENGDFENGDSGVTFVGDGNILSGAQGCVSPFGGDYFGAITTGEHNISTGDAVGGASSIMILGPISSGISSVSFNYNFMSAEFQEFVGSAFDDSFVAMVYGADGAYSEFITSVNIVGTGGNSPCFGFPGMPDNGDTYFGATGWTNKEMSFTNVGDGAYIIFVATDVTDHIYSSVVAIDNVTFN